MSQLEAGSQNTDLTMKLAEYESLRTEVMKRVEIRYQLLSLTLIVVGTLLAVGLDKDNPGSVLLLIPLLSLFLAASYIYNGQSISKIARYMREHVELENSRFGWERFLEVERKQTNSHQWLRTIMQFSATGIFLFSQLISILLAFFRLTFTPVEIMLSVIACISLILTFLMFRYLGRVG